MYVKASTFLSSFFCYPPAVRERPLGGELQLRNVRLP
jgi:hypothetical protein